MRLFLDTEVGRLAVEADPEGTPWTLAALAATLPMRVQFHTPKIAGSHIYWHAPFVIDVEGGVDVMNAAPGAFLYWPERQFLELVYAPLQAETAAVTILGRLDGPIDPLVRLADCIRAEQGRRIIEGRLSAEGTVPKPVSALETASCGNLSQFRASLWEQCPEEIMAMVGSRGLMHPAGPLLFAESEARSLHETLWWLRTRGEPRWSNAAAALACDKAASRLGGFCHLHQTADAITTLAHAFRSGEAAFDDVMKEAILTAGKLADWLDLQIPWNDVNKVLRLRQPSPRTSQENAS